MKRNMTTILLFVVLFVGLALLLYPSVSDFYNSFHQSRAVATYNTAVEQESKKDYEADWAAANAYNEKLRAQSTVDRLIMTDEEREEYDAVMNVGGSGIIGVIEIPQIAVTLPLYHSTNANVLQVAVGHIEGTSLPNRGRIPPSRRIEGCPPPSSLPTLTSSPTAIPSPSACWTRC